MPRGSSALTAQKCPHFDVSKSASLETFLSTYKRIKMATVMETLKSSAKTAINKMSGLKVRMFLAIELKFIIFARQYRRMKMIN